MATEVIFPNIAVPQSAIFSRRCAFFQHDPYYKSAKHVKVVLVLSGKTLGAIIAIMNSFIFCYSSVLVVGSRPMYRNLLFTFSIAFGESLAACASRIDLKELLHDRGRVADHRAAREHQFRRFRKSGGY
jgi:hypothetical protein